MSSSRASVRWDAARFKRFIDLCGQDLKRFGIDQAIVLEGV